MSLRTGIPLISSKTTQEDLILYSDTLKEARMITTSHGREKESSMSTLRPITHALLWKELFDRNFEYSVNMDGPWLKFSKPRDPKK